MLHQVKLDTATQLYEHAQFTSPTHPNMTPVVRVSCFLIISPYGIHCHRLLNLQGTSTIVQAPLNSSVVTLATPGSW